MHILAHGAVLLFVAGCPDPTSTTAPLDTGSAISTSSTPDPTSPCTEFTYYADADGDAFGDPNQTVSACEAPEGYIDSAGDCDDSSAEALPGGTEVCDGLDNDCDGQIDYNTVPGDFATIQEAIDNLPHDTEACVAAGTWTEPLDFGARQVTLTGAAGAQHLL